MTKRERNIALSWAFATVILANTLFWGVVLLADYFFLQTRFAGLIRFVGPVSC